MTFPNLMDSLLTLEAQKIHDAQMRVEQRDLAALILQDLGCNLSRFLAKRLEQGVANVTWTKVHSQCLRMTVTYRGRDWNIRVPVPE